MRLWVFKRHFSTIFQLYIDLWPTFPGANMVQGRNTLGYLRELPFTHPDILHTGKKVRLQIRIDHKMFDMFTSRNVKKIFKYPLSRPTMTMMSDQIVGLRECWLSDSQICRTFWEEYVRPESMIVDTLGVYCSRITKYFQSYIQWNLMKPGPE